MLYVLKGKLIEKKQNPIRAIMETTGCSESTARNKLSGKTLFTIQEALKIHGVYFPDADIGLLFENDVLEHQESA